MNLFMRTYSPTSVCSSGGSSSLMNSTLTWISTPRIKLTFTSISWSWRIPGAGAKRQVCSQSKPRKEPSLLAKNSNSSYLVVIDTHQLNLQNKTGKFKKKPTSSKIHDYKKGILLTKQQLTGIKRNYANREVPKMTRAHSRVDFKVRMNFTGCKLCSKASITTLWWVDFQQLTLKL